MSLKQAVDKTKRYAAFFHARLDDEKLHHWLISDTVYSAVYLKKHFPQKPLPIAKPNQFLLHKAQKVTNFLSFFPSISFIALTGSLAVDNAVPHDDIDLMIITRVNTLWLTRLLVIPLIGLFFKRRTPLSRNTEDSVCLNLWLDEAALAVPGDKRNLYTAHEVLQVKPLFDRGGFYQKFIQSNSWTKNYLANAFRLAVQDNANKSAQRSLATTWAGEHDYWHIRTALNNLAFKLQYTYMKSKITRETITLHSAYFHPRDLSIKLNQYLKD